MNKYIKKVAFLTLNFILFYSLIYTKVYAITPQWEQCSDRSEIVHCETYNARGDLEDIRNDAYCAKPLGGCGTIHYFNENGGLSCSVQIIKEAPNCNITDRPIENHTINKTAVLSADSSRGVEGVGQPVIEKPKSKKKANSKSYYLSLGSLLPISYLGLKKLQKGN